MPDNLTFLTIPLNWRVPGAYLEVDQSKAVTGLPAVQRTMLVLGQRLASGSVAAGVLTLISNLSAAQQYFGRGSMIVQQIAAILNVNPYTKLYACALDDNPAGVFAQESITFTGSPTVSGTLCLYIGGRRLTIGIIATQTLAQIAAAVASAINEDIDGAVTATSAAGVVTCIANHKGSEGDFIDYRVNYYDGEFLPTGLNIAFAQSAAGTGNPNVYTAIAAMSTMAPYSILCGWTDVPNIAALETEMVNRWGGMDMRTGHVFAMCDDTYSNLASYGLARNSPHNTIFGLQNCPTLPWVISAQAGAGCEFSCEQDPAVPLRDIVLPDVLAPAAADQFTDTERNNLLYDGISTIIFDQSGNAMIEQVITTYQTNAAGIPDVSLLKLNTKWTVDYMRYAFRVAVITDYPRHKLADDSVLGNIAPGQPIATPKLIRNTLIACAAQLEYVGLLENLDQFIKDLIVVRSVSDMNRVNAILPPNTVNQFDVFAAAVQFIL
jgi:phage tail sheath gpL-like